MPDSQSEICIKKYAVVIFKNESTCEVIPTNWLISESKTLWPSTKSGPLISKMIADCSPTSTDWKEEEITIRCRTNSFKKAMRKATELAGTSNVSSDSDDMVSPSLKRRKISKPPRYQDAATPKAKQLKKMESEAESSGSDSDSIINSKKNYNIPQLPRDKEMDGNTPKHVSSSKGHTSKDRNDEHSTPFRSQSHSSSERSTVDKDDIPESLRSRLLTVLNKMNQRMGSLERKMIRLDTKLSKLTCTSLTVPPYEGLPEDTDLPVKTVEELQILNEKLKKDEEFSATLVRFLYNSGCGKSLRSFVLSLTKKVLSQEVAKQFSRYGRKGKKAFIQYHETLNAILAAASMRFKEAEREELAEVFGKSLASSSDWNKRKLRPSDLRPFDECSLNFSESLN